MHGQQLAHTAAAGVCMLHQLGLLGSLTSWAGAMTEIMAMSVCLCLSACTLPKTRCCDVSCAGGGRPVGLCCGAHLCGHAACGSPSQPLGQEDRLATGIPFTGH